MKRLLVVPAFALLGCGSRIPVNATFEDFTPVAGGVFVVRWADTADRELLGTRQSAQVPSSGLVQFQFTLPTSVPLRLQYFIDQNGNGKWDGPVGTGEPSWNRETSLPAPVHNRDTIALTVGYGTSYAAVPDDFKAP